MKIVLIFIAATLARIAAFAGTVPPERITVSGNEFRACNGSTRIWMGGGNTPWFLWNDFGNAAFDVNTWDTHYQTLITNKINSSRVWITCSGEVGINISAAGVVGTGAAGSGATAKHWADLDAFFAMAQTRKMYVKATLMSFDHFKSTYTTSARWRNWLNSSANVDTYINTYLVEFLNRYGNNPYLWTIDLCNEPEWASESENTGDCAQYGCLQWTRFQYAWGKMAKAIHDWNTANGHGPLVTVGMGYVKHLSTRAGGSNKVSDAILTGPAAGNAANARLDYWDVHYYLWQQAQVGNPFTQTPNTFFAATLDRPAMLGECPNDGGSDADPPTAVDGPRTLLNDIDDAYANGWQGMAPWTTNNAGSGNFGDWQNDINDATVPFDAAHPGLMFPACSAPTPTRTRTRTPTPAAPSPTRTPTRTFTRTPTPVLGGPYLKTYADPCGINVGTAVVWSAFNSGPAIYRTTLENNFNLVEPENEMKWGELRPNQATFNYTKSDTLIAWAQPRGMKIRGHVLAWHQDNPGWLTGGGFTPAQLNTLLRTHIQTVMPHYAGDVYAWDVVNEAFNEDGSIRSSIWSNAPGIGLPGTQWIEQCFVWARGADPAAKLFYNDYNNEPAGYAKADAVYNMAVDFVNRGVPLDGIGMQIHVVAGAGFPNPAAVRTQINRITALGLDVEITELDVRIQLPTDAAKLAQQAATAQAIIDACLDNPRCRTIQWWGHTDNYSWVPATFPGYGDALLLDTAYNPKPVYNTFLNELNRPCLPAGSPTRTRTRTPLAGTATISPTLTPTPQGDLIDNFEDLNFNNLWGGTWSTYSDAGTTITANIAGPGAPGSTLGRLQLTGTIASYGGVTASFSGSPRDLSQYVGVQFEVRGSGNYWFQAAQANIADGDHNGLSFTATAGWTTVTLYFTNFDQRGFGAAVAFDPSQVTMFQWGSLAAGAMNLEIDNPRVLYYGSLPSPTRTPTVMPSSTRTRTPSPSNSPSPSRTGTASFTPSSTSSRTPTSSLTRTPASSPTRTATPFSSPSGSPSTTGTLSPTLTSSRTPQSTGTATTTATRSFTASPLATTTATPTVSRSFTVSPLATASQTPTVSRTFTISPQATPTLSTTSSPSRTLTGTSTATTAQTASSTVTRSSTVSPLATPTASPTMTRTFTVSPLASATVSPTATRTFTVSPQATATETPSSTGSATATPSASTTRTSSPSVTRTYTVSPPASPTASPTLTRTFTASPQASPSHTPTFTPSSTRTATSSATATWTASPTVTRTLTATLTGTGSLTASPAATGSSTPSASPAASHTSSPGPSQTSSPTPSATPSSAPADNGNPPDIEDSAGVPNPNPQAVAFKLKGRAQRLRVKIWTRSMALALACDSGPYEAGWGSLQLPPDFDALAAGTYYYTVEAESERGKGRSKPGKLLRLP